MHNRGYLQIPADAEIITTTDDGFGRTYKVKSGLRHPVLLYSTPPTPTTIDLVRKNGAELIGSEDGIVQDPKAANNSIGSFYRIMSPGEEVIGRKMPGYEGILEIITYNKVANKLKNMPEGGRGIEITQHGYVAITDFVVGNEKFVKQRGNIFPNEKLVEDVHQNTFADCFLLSSILSILYRKNGTDFIKSMMKQDGDYTIVRLYHPTTLKPIYVRVKNSYHYEGKVNSVHHRAPWVHILEKAYTAIAYKTDSEKSEISRSFPAFIEMYGNGGNSGFALTILTGEKAQEHLIPQIKDLPWQIENLNLCTFVYIGSKNLFDKLSQKEIDAFDFYLQQNLNKDKLLNLQARLSQRDKSSKEIFQEFISEIQPAADHTLLISALTNIYEDNILNEIANFIKKYIALRIDASSEFLEIFKSTYEIATIGKCMNTAMAAGMIDELIRMENNADRVETALEHINDLLEKIPTLPAEYCGKFKAYIFIKPEQQYSQGGRSSNKPALNGEPETGIYNEETLNLYKIIEAAIKTGCPVVTSSRSSFDAENDNAIGLCERHAYCVANVNKRIEGNKKVYEIVLRNPWGRYGRYCDRVNQLKKIANKQDYIGSTENAEFAIDLCDFVKYFRNMQIGKFTAPQLPHDETSKRRFSKWDICSIIMAGILIATIVVAGIFSFGAAPLIGIGVAALFGGLGVTLSTTAATAIGVSVIGAVAATVGSFFVVAMKSIIDKCYSRNKKKVLDDENRPLLDDVDGKGRLTTNNAQVHRAINSGGKEVVAKPNEQVTRKFIPESAGKSRLAITMDLRLQRITPDSKPPSKNSESRKHTV